MAWGCLALDLTAFLCHYNAWRQDRHWGQGKGIPTTWTRQGTPKSWKAATGEVLWTRRGQTQVNTKDDTSEKVGYSISFSLSSPSTQHWTQYEFAIDLTLVDYEPFSSPSSSWMLPSDTGYILGLPDISALQLNRTARHHQGSAAFPLNWNQNLLCRRIVLSRG